MAVDALDGTCRISKSIPENFWALTMDGKSLENFLYDVLPRDHGQPGPFPISETPKIQKNVSGNCGSGWIGAPTSIRDGH